MNGLDAAAISLSSGFGRDGTVPTVRLTTTLTRVLFHTCHALRFGGAISVSNAVEIQINDSQFEFNLATT